MGESPSFFVRRLAQFSVSSRRASLSPADARRMRNFFVDWLGVTLAGSRTPAAGMLRDALPGRREGVSLIGTGCRASELDAALVNGTSGHALDFDDSEFIGETHPSVVTFPVALALAEQLGTSLAETLEAVAVGFRVLRPVGRALNPEHYGRGWHGTASVGVFAAAAAASGLLDLDEDATARALALAASTMSGVQASFGSMAKPLNAGRAAANGLLSARLAQRGFTGPERAFEARAGILELFGGHLLSSDDVEAELSDIAAPLTWIRLKQFPSCHCTHAAMRAALRLRSEMADRGIRRVEVELSDYALPMVSYRRPRSEEEAKFSQSFALATILSKGKAGLEDFRGGSLADPTTSKLEERVACRVRGNLAEMEAIVTVELEDGSRLQADDLIVREDDASEPDFVDAKFRDNLASWEEHVDADSVLGLIDMPDGKLVSSILALLLDPRGAPGAAPSQTGSVLV